MALRMAREEEGQPYAEERPRAKAPGGACLTPWRKEAARSVWLHRRRQGEFIGTRGRSHKEGWSMEGLQLL